MNLKNKMKHFKLTYIMRLRCSDDKASSMHMYDNFIIQRSRCILIKSTSYFTSVALQFIVLFESHHFHIASAQKPIALMLNIEFTDLK